VLWQARDTLGLDDEQAQVLARAHTIFVRAGAGLDEAGKLLTLTGLEAVTHGIAHPVVADRGALLALMNWEERRVVRASPTWSEGLVRFLTHPVLAGLLLSIGGLALLLELRSPGLGIPGLIGVICLALYFGSHYLVSLAGNVELLLFLGGLLLLILEIFVIPGFGAAGIAGIVMLVAGLLLSRVSPHGGMEEIRAALMLLVVSFAVTLVLFLSLLRFLPQARWMGAIVLEDRQDHAVGFHADSHEGEPLLGKRGRSLSDLRPAGIIELEGRRLDVITAGDYIERGALVEVIEIKANRIVVARADTGEA
jgi:membrane-bound serine protease (ClpP class)